MLQFRQILKDIFDSVPLIGQNFLFDAHTIRCRLGLKKFRLAGDTMLMDHFLKAGLKLFSDLDSIGARYANSGMHKSRAKEWREQNSGKSFEDMPMDIAIEYASGDVDITLRAYIEIKRQLEEENRWVNYRYIIHESGFWDVVNDMEWAGMPVDRAALDKLHEEYPVRIDECLRKIQVNRYVFAKTEIDRQMFNEKTSQKNKEIEAYNSTLTPGVKKRPKKLKPTYETWQDWMSKKSNWFNPNSNPQTRTLLTKILPIPWGHEDLQNIEYSDFDRKFSKRRKDNRTYGDKPKGNSHNREILSKAFRRWEKERRGSDVETAEGCRMVAEAIEVIDEFKLLSKMYGTYVKGIYPLIIDKVEPDQPWDPKERCFPLYKPFADFPRPWSIHPSYHINGTETGRLSSSDPNGQNFPKGRSDPKANVKAHYISRWEGKGGLIVQPDYSQIEVRVMVMLAREPQLAEAINRGEDIHRFVASMVHVCSPEDVTKELRDPVMRVTFGIIYGQSVQALAMLLCIRPEEAQNLQDMLFARCPNLKVFIDYEHEFVKKHGYVETAFGRIRYLPHMFSDDRQESSKALRDSVNTPIQCLHPDSLVHTRNGFKKILECAGEEVWDGCDWSSCYLHGPRRKEVVEVTTSIGETVRCSEDHRFEMDDGKWVRAVDLKVGDLLAQEMSRFSPGGCIPPWPSVEDFSSFGIRKGPGQPIQIPSYIQPTKEAAWVVGLLVGDGTYSTRSPGCVFSYKEPELLERFQTFLASMGLYKDPRLVEYKCSPSYWTMSGLPISFTRFIRYLGLEPSSRTDKTVPTWVRNSPPEWRVAFLQGLLDADGGFIGSCKKGFSLV
ncbi:MAG: DNA polymerase, partial [Nitrospira sp.]|nr:DNA polymerase [Nitrospira sp.]